MLRFSSVICLGLKSKTAQRWRNLNIQLSEGKGTLTHTVSDCELARGCSLQSGSLSWRLHTPQRGSLSQTGHSCVLQSTAASSLQPTFSTWTPSASLISTGTSTPRVQLLICVHCPVFRLFNKWRWGSPTDTDTREQIYSYNNTHVVFFMSYLNKDCRA